MESRIWKYPLQITDYQTLRLPQDAQILSVQMQQGILCLWAKVNIDFPLENRHIAVVGTGNPIAFGIRARFIGTVQDGPLVWHVFEV